MGSNAVVPASGAFISRTSNDNAYFSRIHIVRVLEVDIPSGLIRVGPPVDDLVTIPLLGLSIPPNADGSNTANFKASSWGRYIPQVGSMVLVSFATDGRPYTVGYSTISYPNMDTADTVNADSGGIGWGKVSEKNIKPGDWDFRASRGSAFYLGDKATLSSSICSLTLSQNTQDITVNSPIILQKAGNSTIRYGSVRRLELPTDTSESFIYAVPPRLIPGVSQEYSVDLRWNNQAPGGASLVYWGMGDVIDDVTKKARVSSSALPVRRAFTSVDITGLIESYSEIIDTNGNSEVSSTLATSFEWSTLLAAWEISNLSTSISSSTTMDLSTIGGFTLDSKSTVDLSSTASLTLDSALIKVGGSAVSPAVKGTALFQAFTTFNASMAAAFSSGSVIDPSGVGSAAAWAAFALALPILVSEIAKTLSTKVLVE